MENIFKNMLSVDVSKHIEKKGAFSYLSWPFAVSQLRLADPAATWEVKRFAGLPYMQTDLGFFVEVSVTVQGVTLSQIHPVLDGRNRPIAQPTTFDINTSIQRCLVKAIALHGLGLNVYAGEDLPLDAEGGPAQDNVTYLSPIELRRIERMIDQTGADTEALCRYFGFERLDLIPSTEVDRVIKALEAKSRRAA